MLHKPVNSTDLDLHVPECLVVAFEFFAVNDRGQAHTVANAQVQIGRDRAAYADVDAEFKDIECVIFAEVGCFDNAA